jgi:hypothetical protein
MGSRARWDRCVTKRSDIMLTYCPETPGEDPVHLSSYVHALILGLQGGLNPKYKRIVATCKHFVAYDMVRSIIVSPFRALH